MILLWKLWLNQRRETNYFNLFPCCTVQDYVLPNQTALMCETNTLESWAEARSSIKRTQSSSDMLKRRFSSNSPNQDIQSPRYVPRPPHNVSKLAPRAVTAKNPPAGQNVLFSSCASWRKRR